MRFAVLLFLIVATIVDTLAFAALRVLLSSRKSGFFVKESQLGSKPEDEPIECFVTNEEEVLTEGEKPEVVCTADPDGYAWFNGIDPEKMKPTDGTNEGATECVEGASPRGIEEWECRDTSNEVS